MQPYFVYDRFRVWNTSSLVILTAHYINTAVFCTYALPSVEHFVSCHPDSRLHKYGRILYSKY